MTKTTSFRVRVMKYAWQLYKSTAQAWKLCMLKAWQLYKLTKMMREGLAKFYYIKADGSVRKAIGTLKSLPVGISGKKITKPSYKTMTYFDVERNGFRCFRIENFFMIA